MKHIKDAGFLASLVLWLLVAMAVLYFVLTFALAAVQESERCERAGGVLVGHLNCVQKVEGF